MGACSSSQNPGNQQPISDLIPAHRLEALYKFKLLLLGPGESGKSTVLKQLKSIYNVKPSNSEIEECKKALHQNTLECMKILCDQAEIYQYSIEEDDLKKTADWLKDDDLQYEDELITPEQAKSIIALFKSDPIQKTYARRDEFWILDATEYYVENSSRFAEKDFHPDEKDMVYCRIRTTGKNLETKLKVKFPGYMKQEDEPEMITYEVVDVGGQRNERKKWIRMFQDVKAIIFLVNLAGYNQVLYEDPDCNRMAEALNVFSQVTGWRDETKKAGNSKRNQIKGVDIFKNTPIYLLLNKKDLFESMIKKTGLSKTFPEYKGSDQTDVAISFIKQKFKEKCPPGREIQIFDITGISRFDVKTAFKEIERDIISRYQPQIKEQIKKIIAEQRKLNGESSGGCILS